MSERAAYCLLIDGIDLAFWTDEEAAAGCNDTRSASHLGFQLPEVTMSVDLRGGQLLSNSVSFQIEDVDGTLADLFAVEREAEILETPLAPDATAPAALYSKHVGVEQIGSAGERKRFPALVGDTVPIDHTADGQGPAATPVSDDPVIWYGRRCVLYRVTQNSDGTWPALAASMRMWWGTLEDSGTVSGRTWTISASGPESLLQRELNSKTDPSPRVVSGRLVLADDQRYIGVAAQNYDVDTMVTTAIDSDPFTQQWTDEDDVRSTLNSILSALSWGTDQDAGCDINGIWVQAQYDTLDTDAVYVQISMHRDAWAALGYVVDGPERQSLHPTSDPLHLPIYDEHPEIDGVEPPGNGYVCALVSTRSLGDGESLVITWANNGTPRRWDPAYPGGIFPIKNDGTAQLLKFESQDGGALLVEPQLDAPIAADPDDATAPYPFTSGDADAQRLWWFTGKRRQNATSEAFDYAQLGRCSWRGINFGSIDSEALITAWLDPLAYGGPSGQYSGDWMARNAPTESGTIEGRVLAYPAAHFAVGKGANSPALRTLRTLLATSGTSGGWYTSTAYTTQAYGSGTAYLEPGVNDPGDAKIYDRDRADFGLAIPAELIGDFSEWAPADDGISTAAGASIVVVGPVQSDDLIAGIMQPRGWVWSLRGGKYTPFVPWHQSPTVDIVLTPEDMAGIDLPTQSFRVLGPVSSVEIECQRDPVTGTFRSKQRIANRGASNRYGPGGVIHNVKAWGMTLQSVSSLISHWTYGMAWWSKRHFEVTGIRLPLRIDVWPGTRIAITDPRLVSQGGTYGVTSAIGYVTSVTHSCEDETTTISALVVSAPDQPRNRYGPSALVVGIDDTGDILYIDDDWLGVGSGHVDGNGFIEPSWSTAGGSLGIEIWQWDGVSWSGGVTGTVGSYQADPPALVLTGAWSGTLYRDTTKIVVGRPYADQSAAWATSQLCAVADESGEVDGSTSNAGRWFPQG